VRFERKGTASAVQNQKFLGKGAAVPSGRLSRFARFGGLATGVAGGMLINGARQIAKGKRPSISELLLTPATAIKVTHQLSQLRGAAMKIGQLLSMDAGEMLPPELSDILGQLRAEAQHMPRGQLQAVLNRNWGRGWEERFDHFGFAPIAAASIGQVHRATTKDGRDLAIKVQYPGVRQSIDSDVNNVASLMKLSGLVPDTIDIAPLLAEAKRQLHQEADYEQEAGYLEQFGALLDAAPEFAVPTLHSDLTTDNVLAMSYIESVPIETLTAAPQDERDRVVTLLIDLLLRELFDYGLMQTDPNFANYRYNGETGQLVLLDFGATRTILPESAARYRRLMQTGLAGDATGAREAMIAIGFFDEQTQPKHQNAVMTMFEMAMAPLRAGGKFDFGDNSMMAELRDQGMAIAAARDFWHIPPVETLFLQRKFGGMYLLASKLKARIAVKALMERYT
jgi:predicted unusual protein kinase regulating ubiquinone biosynthesis (AarF/ABC1/UbiB family)